MSNIKEINGKTYFKSFDEWYGTDKNGKEIKVVGEKLLKQLETNESKGIGDTIKKITNFLGITQCDGCKQRQEYLNNKFKYYKINLNAITEERLDLFQKAKSTHILDNDSVNGIFAFYNDLYYAHIERCNCPGLFISILEQLEVTIVNQIKDE